MSNETVVPIEEWSIGPLKVFEDEKGFISPTGELMGGHAILAKGVSLKKGYVLLHNSWGKDWGENGTAKIRIEDLARLLEENGEAAIPVRRK